MKLLLASAAAALMASTLGASAADLAKKAPVAVDYVKVCDAYGAGFFYIPGTDTCLKIGGYVRVQATGGDDDYGNFSGDDDANSWNSYARLQLQVDARSQTEYGVLRSFAAVNTQFESGASTSSKLDKAYIQWAGFTAGYAASRWDFFTGYAPAVLYGELAHDDTVNLLAYTFAFGNGLSATISVEDATFAGRQGEYDTDDYPSRFDIYGGNKSPDIVANLNLEQGWGTAQLMAAAHQLQSSTGSEGWGFAVGGGVTVKLPTLGAKDELGLQVAYADGALRYLALDYSDETYDFGPDAAANKWSGFSVFGGFQHSFTPTVTGALQGGYLSIDADTTGYSDYDRWEATASLTWTPVTNLEITSFVEYRSTDYDASSSADADGVLYGLRMQRNF